MRERPRRFPRVLVFLALMSTCIGCDRVAKHTATSVLEEGNPMSFAGDVVRIEYARNPGAFLGLGGGLDPAPRFWLLTAGTAVLLLGACLVLFRQRDLRWTSFVALTLVVAGGVGNLWDRALQGFVVDFVSLGLGSVRTGIFNLADVAITAGALWLILESLRRAKAPDCGRNEQFGS